MFNYYFDKIYCINLERRTDRWDKCLKQFRLHNLTVDRFNAIDGRTLIEPNCIFETVGQYACLLSHLEVIKKAKELNLSSVLIMEDDVKFCDNFDAMLTESMAKVPSDWDMIFFGSNHIIMPEKINSNIFKLVRSYSAHCYAINAKMFDLLIGNLSKEMEPLDVTYANLQPHINAYVINPHLTWQDPGYSDICEQYVDYTHAHKKSLV
jgi:GR25 family glycosyltransferase involved in LPS biosynthesis